VIARSTGFITAPPRLGFGAGARALLGAPFFEDIFFFVAMSPLLSDDDPSVVRLAAYFVEQVTSLRHEVSNVVKRGAVPPRAG
jgi:hypothetical protein